MDIQKIRNFTTGRLHTTMDDLYSFVEYVTGEPGVFTHMLPNARTAMLPWLKEKLPEMKFWEDTYDPTHVGDIDLPPMNDDERAAFWARYSELPSLLEGEKVIAVSV